MKKWLSITLASLSWAAGLSTVEASFYAPPPFGAGLASSQYGSCCDPCEQPLCCGNLNWTDTSYIWGGGTVGRGYGLDPGHGSFGTFLSLPTSSNNGTVLPFVDVKAHVLKNNIWAVNAGLGIRFLDTCAARVYGINAYYDYRQVQNASYFNQVGFGVESLGMTWDFRLNGYFPVDYVTTHGPFEVFDDYDGNYVVIANERYTALKGFDAEIGWHMFRWCGFDFYSALGTYYFAQLHDHAWGVKGRLGVDFNNYISAEVRTTYDKLYNTKVQGVFELAIPFDLFMNFCWSARDVCAGLISQPVERNDLIVLNKCCNYRWNF